VKHANRWGLLTLAVLALGYLGVGLFVAARLTVPVRQPTAQTPADEGLDFQEVGFESTDGLALRGWWVPGDNPSRAVVLVHGLEGNKAGEQVLRAASVYSGAGYGVLMFDLRGHGEFEGKRTTVGHQEVRDVRGALPGLRSEASSRGKWCSTAGRWAEPRSCDPHPGRGRPRTRRMRPPRTLRCWFTAGNATSPMRKSSRPP
jgi:hypothetical protein